MSKTLPCLLYTSGYFAKAAKIFYREECYPWAKEECFLPFEFNLSDGTVVREAQQFGSGMEFPLHRFLGDRER